MHGASDTDPPALPISGTLALVGQDGQTGLAQTFSGSISQGLASLNFSHAGVRTAAGGRSVATADD